MAFNIGWILGPRGSNHAQLTIKDVYLMFTLKAKIQTDWAELVCDTILKAIGLPMYPLPYEIFLPKVLEYYNVDLTNEVYMDLTFLNKIEDNGLHHMDIFLLDKEWMFKDNLLRLQKMLIP